MPKTAQDFRRALDARFRDCERKRRRQLIVRAGDLHSEVGEYPGHNHRMPVCCGVMRGTMVDGDRVLEAPPQGNGASLTISYAIPRGRAARDRGPDRDRQSIVFPRPTHVWGGVRVGFLDEEGDLSSERGFLRDDLVAFAWEILERFDS